MIFTGATAKPATVSGTGAGWFAAASVVLPGNRVQVAEGATEVGASSIAYSSSYLFIILVIE